MDGAHFVLGLHGGDSLGLTVVIHNFHIARIAVLPDEAQAKLVVDTNAVLFRAVTRQCFQSAHRQIALADP